MSDNSENSSNGSFPRWDASHHRMASWDGHAACRTCMRQIGRACSSSQPCDVCVSWSEETWQKVHRADLRSAKRRLGRAESRLSLGNVRSRSIKASVSRCAESDGTGLAREATLADEVPFYRSGFSAGKPHGGAGTKACRETGTGTQMINAPDRPGVFVTSERSCYHATREGQTDLC